jgi:Ni/Fe-hydrogenase subunit HybB-like protein
MTAIAMGYAVTMFESLLSSMIFKRPFETPILAKVSTVMFWLVIAYLVLRFGDLLLRGQFATMFNQNLNSMMFFIENILFLQAVIILASPARRRNTKWLFITSVCLLLAGSIYRFNAFLVGYNPGPGWSYFPALPEIMITLGIVALELMGYLYFVKRYPILPKVEHA